MCEISKILALVFKTLQRTNKIPNGGRKENMFLHREERREDMVL